MEREMTNEILVAISRIDHKVDNIQEELKEIRKEVAKIPEIERQVAKIPEIERQVAKIPEMQEQIADMQKQVAKIPEIEEQVAKIPEIEEKVAKIPKIEEQVAKIPKMQEQIKELQEETRSISRSVARIEYEHGQKIDLILDILIGHIDKFEQTDRRQDKDEKIIEIHGHRIYALEQQKEK